MASRKMNKKASRSLAERKAMRGGKPKDESMAHERAESKAFEKKEGKGE